MKRLRRLSLSFRRSSRQQVDSDSNVEYSADHRDGAVSDDEALPRRPRRRLTKKKLAPRPGPSPGPSLEGTRDPDQQQQHPRILQAQARAPPSPSPSPSPPLARVPFPPQKRVPPPSLPGFAANAEVPPNGSPGSSSMPTDSPPVAIEQMLGPNLHDDSLGLGLVNPATPPLPSPTPLSVIVEQDERSLRSAGFSLHSGAGLPAGEAREEHTGTSGERRRTVSGLSSLKDGSRPGSASDKARSIYERPPAPAPPSPPATPTREVVGEMSIPTREVERQMSTPAASTDARRWTSEAGKVMPHLLDDSPLEQEEEKEEEEEYELYVLQNSNHAPLSRHDQEQDDKPLPEPIASPISGSTSHEPITSHEPTKSLESTTSLEPTKAPEPTTSHEPTQALEPTTSHEPTKSFEPTTHPIIGPTSLEPTTSLEPFIEPTTSPPSQSTTSLPSQSTSLPSQPPSSWSNRPISLPPQPPSAFQLDGRTLPPIYAPNSNSIYTLSRSRNRTRTPDSSTARLPHSPTDTDAYTDVYATATESLMGDGDEGYATPVGEEYATSVGDGEGYATSVGDGEGYATPVGDGEGREGYATPVEDGESSADTDEENDADGEDDVDGADGVGLATQVARYDDDTPTATIRARDRSRIMAGIGTGMGEVYQYPPARHTFGLWDVAGASAQEDEGEDRERDEDEDDAEQETHPATVDIIHDPWHIRHASNSTTSPTPTHALPLGSTPASPVIPIPNPVPTTMPPLNHDPASTLLNPLLPIISVVTAPASMSGTVPESESVELPPVPPYPQTLATISESLPEDATLPHIEGSAPFSHISESASLPHLSDSVHSLPLPLPPSLSRAPGPPSSYTPTHSSSSQPQVPEAHTPSPPAPPTPPSPSSHARPNLPRALRPHPFLEGHAGEKLGGRGGGQWDVRVSGGEWMEGGARGEEGEEDENENGDREEEGDEDKEEGEGEQGDEDDGECETEEEEIPVQRPVEATFAHGTVHSRRVGAADRRATPLPGQAHLVETSTPLQLAQFHPHSNSSSQNTNLDTHNRALPAIPRHPPGLPTPTPTQPRGHLTSDTTSSSHATTVSPMVFARRPSLVPAPAPFPASSSSPPASSSSSPPPPATSASLRTWTSALPISSSSPSSPSPSPLSRSGSLTRLIASTFRPARTVLKKRRRTVSSGSERDGGASGARGIEPGFTMVTPGGEAYDVEAWHGSSGREGRDVSRRGARVYIQPPSPSPPPTENSQPQPQPQPPPRQQMYSWAGQEEFTASLVAEYGAMLTPFLATPGNSRPQSYEDHVRDGASGNASAELAGEQTLSVRTAEQERAALLAATPPKRVGRKLSKRRKPVPVPS